MSAGAVHFEQAGLNTAEQRERISGIFETDVRGTEPKRVKQKMLQVFRTPAADAVTHMRRLLATFEQGPGRTCLLAVNSGPESLPAELFKILVSDVCGGEAPAVGAAVCLTLHHHKRPFDNHFLFDNDVLGFSMEGLWPEVEAFASAAGACFDEVMAALVRDQQNPALWSPALPPVVRVVFEAGGVSYVRG